MIIFTSIPFDLIGEVIIQEDAKRSGVNGSTRRATRSATLDGEASIDDAGFSHGDKEFIIYTNTIAEEEFERLQRLQELYGIQRCATKDGVFTGTIYSIAIISGKTAVRFLVKEKVSA